MSVLYDYQHDTLPGLVECINCGKNGHHRHQCKMPITSIGIIVIRINPYITTHVEYQYLMICRKDTLGYIDFIRGKYSIYDKNYLSNMIFQMTVEEKYKLKTLTFDAIWDDLWNGNVDIHNPANIRTEQHNMEELKKRTVNNTRKNDDLMIKERFYNLVGGVKYKKEFYTLNSLIEEGETYMPVFVEPEWGFPKGRKNLYEKDLQCAVREFEEETGYSQNDIHIIENIIPFEEIFIGSNYKSYKHKYFLAFMPAAGGGDTQQISFQKCEVSKMVWKSFDECIACMRDYNIEKKEVLRQIHNTIKTYKLY